MNCIYLSFILCSLQYTGVVKVPERINIYFEWIEIFFYQTYKKMLCAFMADENVFPNF